MENMSEFLKQGSEHAQLVLTSLSEGSILQLEIFPFFSSNFLCGMGHIV